jgi:hypothetical protein
MRVGDLPRKGNKGGKVTVPCVLGSRGEKITEMEEREKFLNSSPT